MHRPRPRLRRDFRLITADGVISSVMVGIGETYLAAFALAVGISAVLSGLLVCLPLVAGGALQLVAPAALHRFRSYRGFVLLGYVAQAASFLPLVGAAIAEDAPPVLLFGCATIYWAAGLATAPAWNAWVSQLVPLRIRGRFFGRRQSAAQFGVVGGILAGGLLLRATGSRPRSFAVLFALAFAGRALSTFLVSRQSVPTGRPPPERVRVGAILGGAWRSRSRELIGLILLINLANHLAAPFFVPFVLVELDASYLQLTAILASNFAGKILAYPLVGRIARRAGVRQLMAVGALGLAPMPILWIWMPSVHYLLPLHFLAGCFWASLELGILLGFLDVGDDRERTSLLATFHFFNSITMATASIGGAALLAWIGADHRGYLLLFAVSTIGRLLGSVVLIARARRGMATGSTPLRLLAMRPWVDVIARAAQRPLDAVRRFTGRA